MDHDTDHETSTMEMPDYINAMADGVHGLMEQLGLLDLPEDILSRERIRLTEHIDEYLRRTFPGRFPE